MRSNILWVAAVILVGVAAFLGGRQVGFDAGLQSRENAARQFFAQRGGSQAGEGQPGAGQGLPGGGQGENVAGVVESVDGTRIVLSSADGTKLTVALASGGTIRKQVEGSIGDLKAGERIIAFGIRSGDSFQASTIQIGGGRVRP